MTSHRFCDGLSCRGTVGERGGRWTERRKFMNFFTVGRHCSHMNTWRCGIAQLTLTFSSACDTQLHCQLHRRVLAPHATRRQFDTTLYACASLNLRFGPFQVTSSMIFLWRWGCPICCSTIYTYMCIFTCTVSVSVG